jgi:hypothetical protein
LQFYFTAEQERHKKEKEEEKKKKKKAEVEEAKEKEKERKKKEKAVAGSSRHGLVTSSGTHQSGGAAWQAQHLSSQPNAVCTSSNAPVITTTSADAIPMTLPPDRTKRQGYWASFCLWLYLRCTCANSTESS